ncbi:chemotaxis protein CheW [Fictibacillus aquaticus]|uniref:CheW-like domain-containing protein n=1 Tax=Fictibacillus aquaticus TaxID=2021314 RepID=A0A235FBM0_9BACL|nr:chemotaxis protein CheW [Fictibacillus aquaticus]OYD58622.1 hypothetical protein CGZ90_01595 [Fictibacillus aquaticus]
MKLKDAFDEFKAVAFKIGSEEYAFHIEQVISIEKPQPITAVPGMPEHVLGIINLRGNITPIINLSSIFFSGSSSPNSLSQRYIVVKYSEKPIGLVVDEATDVLDIPVDTIQKDTLSDQHSNPYLIGISNLGKRLLILIDVNQLLSSLSPMLHDFSENKILGSVEHETQYSN